MARINKGLTPAELIILLTVYNAPEQKMLFGRYGPFVFDRNAAVRGLLGSLDCLVELPKDAGVRITAAGKRYAEAALSATGDARPL